MTDLRRGVPRPSQTAVKSRTAEAAVAVKAIASSPEALARPELALAAIRNDLTLHQFKVMAAVPRESSAEAMIDRRMAGAPRLRADAPSAVDGASGLGRALVADAKAKRYQGG